MACNIQALSEALTLAKMAGVDPELVFQAIRKKSRKDLLNAYLFHFVIDSLAVLLSAVASVWVVELVVALVTGGAVLMAKYACMEE